MRHRNLTACLVMIVACALMLIALPDTASAAAKNRAKSRKSVSRTRKKTQKLPLKVAVVIPPDRKLIKFEKDIWGFEKEYTYQHNPIRHKTITTDVNVNIEFGNEYYERLDKRFSELFENIDFYGGTSNINMANYDLVLESKTFVLSGESHGWTAECKIELPIYFSHRDSPEKSLARYTGVGTYRLMDDQSTLGFIFGVNMKQDVYYYYSESKEEAIQNAKDGLKYVYEKAFESAMEDLLRKIAEGISSDPTVEFALRDREQKLALPCALALNVKFEDSDQLLPNSILDAYEKADLKVSVRNSGEGVAYETALSVSGKNRSMEFPASIEIGDIAPGESKEVVVPVSAGASLSDGQADITFEVVEKRGFNSRKLVVSLPTAAVVAPVLNIAKVEVNDSSRGLASGNGNSIAENGETIELAVTVENQGQGASYGTVLSLDLLNSDLGEVKLESELGLIRPGGTDKGTVAFSIPRAYTRKHLELKLAARDTRDLKSAVRDVAIPFKSLSPQLRYTYEVYDGGSSGSEGNRNKTIENGEIIEIMVTPSNEGELTARDVRVVCSSKNRKISPSPSSLHFGTIPPHSKAKPQSFSFKVPRTFGDDNFRLGLLLSQSDFPGTQDEIALASSSLRPQLRVVYDIGDEDGDGVVTQGDMVTLTIKVANQGSLGAEGVSLTVRPKKKGVALRGADNFTIGSIPAESVSGTVTCSYFVKRQVRPGEIPFEISVTQSDFSGLTELVAVNVSEEEPERQVVKAERTDAVSPRRNVQTKTFAKPPDIFIDSPKNNDTTVEEKAILSGFVIDSEGVLKVDVFVNGNPLPREAFTKGVHVVARERKTDDSPTRRITAMIPLALGENNVSIVATNIAGLSKTEKLTIHRKQKTGEVYVLCIGIGEYEDPAITDLEYAERDAQLVYDFFASSPNSPAKEENIRILLGKQATMKGIKSAIYEHLIRNAADSADTAILYYSGHGDTGFHPERNTEYYMIPQDAAKERLFSEAIEVTELQRLWSAIRAERKVFVADSCNSGGFAALRGGGDRDFRAGLGETGRICFLASSPAQKAIEWREKGQGLFTYCFLQGLRGAADGILGNADGRIDAAELQKYLDQQVPKNAGKIGGNQKPYIKIESAGTIFLTK